LALVEHGLDELIVRKLGLKAGELNLDRWRDLLHRLRNPQHEITIAVVGKYAEHRDAYKSIYEALDHAGVAHQAQVSIRRVHSEAVEREGTERLLAGVDGVLVPGGFGERGIEGKVDAIRFARLRGIPFFGICLGMQCAVAEFGRSLLGLERANSTEFDRDTPHPVICLLDEQRTVTDKGGTMRLGAQPARLMPGSKAAACYGTETISERHRHRYEFNNNYRQQYEAAGLKVVGTSPDGTLVEIIEVADHPWFVAVQFHPEFKSQPTRPHPLFAGFIGAAVARRAAPAKAD
jgi:CTP synthase